MPAATRVASTSAVVALVLATVWLFWPAGLGGGTTYVTTHGTSMEPEFNSGDLVVLSRADRYAVGDVVAYRSESLDSVVMHRIVSGDARGFVTQGDNNDWLDEDRPTAEEIFGRQFLHLPQGGTALGALASPWSLGLVAAAASLLVGSTRRVHGRHSPRRRRRPALRRPSFSAPALALPRFSAPALPRVGAPALPMVARARARQVALGAGAVALVAAVGAGVLVLLPATEQVTETLQVTQEGTFTYAGSAERGTTYPTGAVATGDTVWTKLATGLTVSYTDTVVAPDVADLRGALRLDVSIRAADGWSTYLSSGPVVPLDGGTATATVAVDPAQASAVLARHHDEVGMSGSGATLTITPTVALTGTVRGVAFEAENPPGLDFVLDPTSLRLTGEPESVLATTGQTPVSVEEVAPRSFDVLAVSVPIGVARVAAVVVLALALVVAAAGAWIGQVGRGDVADGFLLRHADRIVPVATLAEGATVIDVADAEALHRVAERFDTVVLHHAGPDEDVFAVRDVDATYRFVVPGTPGRRGRPPVPAAARAPLPEEPAAADLTTPLGLRGRFA
ncbi:signal peptidase I [Blastococcus xanthinilyticus]|uniref:Signal peptidase I n=1 Tax=Blastococcus xanthinilyticus TaxID=1564164 RepID=A0A5S5CSC2_9ACTN|nr:signal peptidase I [Blastococcus xanthinilyticus]TYP86613.1 signal peptidase I [Blastococcus xanthinilyticus]